MAKKKSKRFIIPAAFFINAVIEEKIDATVNKKQHAATAVINEPKTKYASDKKETSEVTSQKTQTVPPPTEAVKFNKAPRRKSALSISSLKRDKIVNETLKNKQKVVENFDDLPKDSFTEAAFIEIWNAYIDELHKNGEKIFASILKADTPVIKNNLICVTYPNEMMKTELNKVKSKALKHLREKLNNYSLEFKIDVNEENTKRFAYTPQEKYEFLKTKNEAIIKLKNTFNLEL